MNLDDALVEALSIFLVESRELLEQMESILLHIEQTPDDIDTLNALFRVAHTIKGSAGLFGLDHIVGFTHVAESVLDKVRCGELKITADLIARLLEVRDHLSRLVEYVASHQDPSAEVHTDGDVLVQKLLSYLVQDLPKEGNSIPITQVAVLEKDKVEDSTTSSTHWHISLRFGRGVLKNGMDPLAFIRYLKTFGSIARIITLTDIVPPLSELDPEDFYLGFEIGFETSADKAMIEDAFAFVRDDANIRILPPHSKISEYLSLIQDIPGEDLRLGDLLVQCGTLTANELTSALKAQSAIRDSGQVTPVIGEVLLAQQVVRPAVIEAALEKQIGLSLR